MLIVTENRKNPLQKIFNYDRIGTCVERTRSPFSGMAHEEEGT